MGDNDLVLSAAGFEWSGSASPWWVTPAVTLAAVWITARATARRDKRVGRRRAVVGHREAAQKSLEITPTGPWSSFTPEERELELTLIDLGFTRFQVWDLTRQLWDYRQDKNAWDRLDALTLKELTVVALHRGDWRALQEVVGRYVSGEISLYRTRRKLFGYFSTVRRTRRSRRWAKSQYDALHS